ncbi:MAG: hypothetical protein IKQ89_02885, partial [Muribaculaceae bacterium]|nr:hypothetical protein [Muribaculaceae bacterium]
LSMRPLSHSGAHTFGVRTTMCFAQLQVLRLATASINPRPFFEIGRYLVYNKHVVGLFKLFTGHQ